MVGPTPKLGPSSCASRHHTAVCAHGLPESIFVDYMKVRAPKVDLTTCALELGTPVALEVGEGVRTERASQEWSGSS